MRLAALLLGSALLVGAAAPPAPMAPIRLNQIGLLHFPRTAVVLAAAAKAMPFFVVLVRATFMSVPRELEEAALVDGNSRVGAFFSIVLPNIRPALATLTVFAFMGSWNSFLWPLVVLRKPELQTLPVALAGLQGQYTTDWDVVMAGSVVSVLPILAIYLFAQKYVIQGVASSGIK